ncbi:mechanosensitive ion channel family protein [bacterium]|nr:mechanosensitive ion channel family protein [bacterium]
MTEWVGSLAVNGPGIISLVDFADLSYVDSLGLVIAAVCLVLAILLRWLLLRFMDGYLKRVVDRTQSTYDNKVHGAMRRSVGYFTLLGGCYLAMSFIELPVEPINWHSLVMRVLATLFMVSAGLLLYRMMEITLSFLTEDNPQTKRSVLDDKFLPLLRDVTKVGLILLVAVGLAQTWGYSPAGILAGAGIGGLALAFAAQDAVANVFGSFVVFSDRPYKIGDWIQIAGIEGTVEEIGIRSTRIRQFDQALVSVPNKVVTNESIYNYSEMPIRRISLDLRLGLDTQPEQVLGVVKDIRELLKGHAGIDQDYWVVSLSELSTYSLDIIVYCFTRSTVWEEFLEVKQDLLLRIMDICRSRGARVAFPSSTVYYNGADPAGQGSMPAGQMQAAAVSAEEARSLGVPLPASFRHDPASAPQSGDSGHGMEFNRTENG